MPCSTTLLPAVRATMSIASRMGTPEDSRVPMVRVKRATTTLRSTGPSTGSFSKMPSKVSRPFSVFRIIFMADADRHDRCR